jgi:hypothetical protein
LNALTQQDFYLYDHLQGAYNPVSMRQLRSLADHGHAEARELLALEAVVEPVEDVNTEIEPIPTKSKSLWGWLDRMTEANYKAWVKAGRPEIY